MKYKESSTKYKVETRTDGAAALSPFLKFNFALYSLYFVLAMVALGGCRGYKATAIHDPALPVEEPQVVVSAPELQPVHQETTLPPDRIAYTSVAGDTLESVARDRLGHPLLWRHLMEWNKRPEGPRDELPLDTGLEIPLACRGIIGTTIFVDPAPAPEPAPVEKPPHGVEVPKLTITPPSQVFQPGESLDYAVKWFIITAGHANMSVESRGIHHGRETYKLLSRARSKLLFFFKVNDWAESYCTTDDLLSVRFEKHIREGRYRKDLIATFDQDNLTADWGGTRAPMSDNCRDILAAVYYCRTMQLPPVGQETSICVNNNRKNYEVVVKVLRREMIEVPAGKFRTILIQPMLKFEGLFRQDGEVSIWLTDDVARIPVLLKSKVFLIGSVDIVLEKLQLGGEDR